MTKTVRFTVLAVLAVASVGALMAAQPTNQKWEFKVEPVPQTGADGQTKHLSALGEDGWQLVQVSDGMYYLTRETR